MKTYILVLCWFTVKCVNGYKAGVIESSDNDVSGIIPLVYEAGNKNVDILVLSSDMTNFEESYDETVKELSKAAKNAGLYLVANLNEKAACQKKHQIVRSNIVFDRHGSIVSVYKKPTTHIANCTIPSPGLATFTTDFDVTFGVMMEEDLVLKSAKLNGLKDFVVTGKWASEIPFLNAAQFTSTWAYTVNANVLSRHGIFAGRSGVQTGPGRMLIGDLKRFEEDSRSYPPVINPASFPGEDLSQFLIRPLNVEASSDGYKESVCHNSFCCEFDVKTNLKGSKQELNYGLAVFDGIRHYGGNHHIGIQTCALFACAGLYKRTCNFGSVNNNTNISFEKLSITANFTKHNSVQYPVIMSNELLPADRFSFTTKSDEKSKQVTISLTNSDNLLTFGIFGRDFENDYESMFENKDGAHGIYDYIFNEDLHNFFDYVWIRLRILILIVSIYVLEMM